MLFSGGLDSILAVKLLQQQELVVWGIAFSSYFFNTNQAEKSAKNLGIELIKKDISRKQLASVKQPRFGYGKALNPCIDCHLLMIKEAFKVFQAGAFDVFATGEVLGRRSFSQNRFALKQIEKMAELENKILRPLSARALAETEYEKKGIVNRSKLEEIKGRSRRRQIALAKKFGIKQFPSPAGGCLLTEKGFSQKLKRLLEKEKSPNKTDFVTLRVGRHLWIKDEKERCYGHLILGRNQKENQFLEEKAEKGDILIKRKDALGPTALLRKTGQFEEAFLKKINRIAQKKIWQFSKKRPVSFEAMKWETLRC